MILRHFDFRRNLITIFNHSYISRDLSYRRGDVHRASFRLQYKTLLNARRHFEDRRNLITIFNHSDNSRDLSYRRGDVHRVSFRLQYKTLLNARRHFDDRRNLYHNPAIPSIIKTAFRFWHQQQALPQQLF